MKKWYRLDNAAKIFPILYSNKNKNSFRVSVLLEENIDVAQLKTAVKMSLERFPMFNVRIKRGLFWYYFEECNNEILIEEENKILFNSVHYKDNNEYLFTVSYFKNRIVLEMFHGLSDGSGGMEFLKSICYNYLLCIGKKIENDGNIKTNFIESNLSELTDSYNSNYYKNVQKFEKESKAFKIKHDVYNKNFGLIQVKGSIEEFKAVSKKYGLTITKYLVAKLLYTFYKVYFKNNLNEGNVKILIPVNARKIIDSISLRNFALYIRTNYNMGKKEITFNDCINHVNETFTNELTEEKLLSRLAQNVKFEKKIIVQFLPLFIKKIGMKIGYKIIGSSANSLSISNLGVVNIPKEMENHVKEFNFIIGASKQTPINLGVVSYKDKLVISIVSKVVDRRFQKEFIRSLSEECKVVIETNDLEWDE